MPRLATIASTFHHVSVATFPRFTALCASKPSKRFSTNHNFPIQFPQKSKFKIVRSSSWLKGIFDVKTSSQLWMENERQGDRQKMLGGQISLTATNWGQKKTKTCQRFRNELIWIFLVSLKMSKFLRRSEGQKWTNRVIGFEWFTWSQLWKLIPNDFPNYQPFIENIK